MQKDIQEKLRVTSKKIFKEADALKRKGCRILKTLKT